MATDVNGARWMTWRGAWAVDTNQADAGRLVSEAVVQTNEVVMFVTNNGVQLLGGHGYIQDHPVEKWMRDAKMQQVLGGSSDLENLYISSELTKPKAKKKK